jgi:hypothetical protein
MVDYGFKVSKAGFDVLTTADKNLIFSSAFGSLKVHTQGTGTLLDSARTITVAHGLGYVPMFLVHTQTEGGYWVTNTDYVIAPHVPVTVGGCYLDRQVRAYADSTNLYIEAEPNFGVARYSISSTNLDECFAEEDVDGTDVGWWELGYDRGANHGAIRFGSITLANSESIYSATLNIYIGGRIGSGEIKSVIYGIDEDNIGKFNDGGSNPTARVKTTASTASNSTLSQGNILGVNVKSIVDEIIARGGWASDNAMAFILNDNSTPSGNGSYYEDALTSPWGQAYCSYTNLRIVKSNTLANVKYTIYYNQIE